MGLVFNIAAKGALPIFRASEGSNFQYAAMHLARERNGLKLLTDVRRCQVT